ncbi:MAG TPA: PEP-CTERM sorting domain-containing protein [Tepidisphaeraceae bacterium]|nr:PEP-CTERM sorting domain-containing protein [Tepidisphaeraceae bacterium]
MKEKSNRSACGKTLWLFGAAIVAASAMNVRASLLVSDTFNYPTGNLVGNTPPIGGIWTAHSGAPTNPIQVANSDSIIVNESTGVEDDHSTFAGGFTAAAGDVLYSSFTINVPVPTGTLTPVYFASFLESTSDFDSRVWVTTPATSGDGYQIALSEASTLNATKSVYSGDLQFGTTYTVVTSYDYTNKDGSLWIDPTSPVSPALGTTTDTGFSDAVTAYAFRQSAVTGNAIITVGDLQVGTSLADVVVVPEPASLGIIALGGMALLRRRRRGGADH